MAKKKKYELTGVAHALCDKHEGKTVTYKEILTLIDPNLKLESVNIHLIKSNLKKIMEKERYTLETVRGEGVKVLRMAPVPMKEKTAGAEKQKKKSNPVKDSLKVAAETLPVNVPVPETDNTEAVNHPNHYNSGSIEVIDAIDDWKLGFSLGNAVMYIARAEHKGNKKQDLEKAAWYLQHEIERMHEAGQ